MTAETAPNLLSDEKLDRLEELLADPSLENAMRLDEAQGYLCAALAGPQPMPPEQWLADILGNETALEIPVGLEAAGLLRQFADALEAELAEGTPPVLLLYPCDETEDSPSDYFPGAKPIWPESMPLRKTGSSSSAKMTRKTTRRYAKKSPTSTNVCFR